MSGKILIGTHVDGSIPHAHPLYGKTFGSRLFAHHRQIPIAMPRRRPTQRKSSSNHVIQAACLGVLALVVLVAVSRVETRPVPASGEAGRPTDPVPVTQRRYKPDLFQPPALTTPSLTPYPASSASTSDPSSQNPTPIAVPRLETLDDPSLVALPPRASRLDQPPAPVVTVAEGAPQAVPQDSPGLWPARTAAPLSSESALPAFDMDTAEALGAVTGWSNSATTSHLPANSAHAVRLGWLTIPNPMNWWPKQTKPATLRVDVAIPVNEHGRPLPGAADLIAVVPWQQIPTGLATDFSVKFCRKAGFTVFSVRFGAPAWEHADDQQHFYRFPSSGSDEAWLAAAEAVRAALGTPKRKFFVWGQSVGGSAAAFLADACPEHVEALGFEATSLFATTPRYAGPVLSLQPYNADPGPAPQEAWLAARPKSKNGNVTKIRYRPNFAIRGQNNDNFMAHMTPPDIRPVVMSWFAALADQRAKLPPRSTTMPAWIKDGATLVPSNEVKADVANMVPPPALAPGLGKDLIWIAKPGAAVTPRAAVVIADGDLGTQDQDLMWDLQMLAERGFVAIGARSLAEPATTVLGRRALPLSKSLPVIIVRIGDAGPQAALMKALQARCRGEIGIPVRGMTFDAGSAHDSLPRLLLQPPTGTPKIVKGAWSQEVLPAYTNYAGRRAAWMRTIAVAVDALLNAEPLPATKP